MIYLISYIITEQWCDYSDTTVRHGNKSRRKCAKSLQHNSTIARSAVRHGINHAENMRRAYNSTVPYHTIARSELYHLFSPECRKTSGLTRDGTANLSARDQILKRGQGQGKSIPDSLFQLTINASMATAYRGLVPNPLGVMILGGSMRVA